MCAVNSSYTKGLGQCPRPFFRICNEGEDNRSNNHYLFDHCGLLRAFLRPGFLRSLTLGSLLSKPCGLRVSLYSSLKSTSALANHSLIASACPIIPPPVSTISASNCC